MIKVNNKEISWREGMTITDALKEAKINEIYFMVRVNGKIVTVLCFDDFLVIDGSEIYTIIIVGG